MRSTIASIVSVALALSVAGWVHPAEAQQRSGQAAQQSQQNQQSQRMNASEKMLEDQIYVRLAERAWAGSDFKATVNQGVVTLSGTVPTEQTKQKILRLTRRTPGVMEVRDQLRVNPAVGALRGGSTVPDAELSKRVAQKIAATLTGAKAAEDWWFTGWRVEGQDRMWTMIVQAEDGAVTLEGEVPYNSTIRKAVDAALDVQGVRSVRSEIELEPAYYPYYRYGYPYAYRYGYYDPDYFVYYDASRDAHDFKGVQTLTGEVTKIDPQKGMLTLKTDRGSFDLSFPPASLQGVKQGERINVQLGFRPVDSPAASPPSGQSGTTQK